MQVVILKGGFADDDEVEKLRRVEVEVLEKMVLFSI